MLKHPILLPIALMLFLALLTFWINQTVQEQGLSISRLNRHDPDYMLYNFVSTRTNAAGKTKYVLAATEMRHFPDNDYTELKRPRFTQFGLDKPYTQVYGQRGKISANGKLVEFNQQVKVTRQGTAEKGEMQLQTEKLIMEPDTEVSYTDLPVTGCTSIMSAHRSQSMLQPRRRLPKKQATADKTSNQRIVDSGEMS